MLWSRSDHGPNGEHEWQRSCAVSFLMQPYCHLLRGGGTTCVWSQPLKSHYSLSGLFFSLLLLWLLDHTQQISSRTVHRVCKCRKLFFFLWTCSMSSLGHCIRFTFAYADEMFHTRVLAYILQMQTVIQIHTFALFVTVTGGFPSGVLLWRNCLLSRLLVLLYSPDQQTESKYEKTEETRWSQLGREK